MSTQAAAKALGPYDLTSFVGPEGGMLVSLPWAKVVGSQLIVVIADNYAQKTGGLGVNYSSEYWATAEITINGSIQGREFVLKRQQCRLVTGPMIYRFDDEEGYDQVVIRGRNMSGGRRGPSGGLVPNPSQANGYKIEANVMIMPRSGLGPSKRIEMG